MSRTMDIINIYQEMVRDQVYDLANSKDKGSTTYRLYYFDDRVIPIASVEKGGYRYEFQKKILDKNIVYELIRRGLLIKVGCINGVDIYTTLHADVVFRVLRGRAFEDYLDGRWVGYYDIEIKDEYMPDFNAVDIDQLRDKLNQFFKNNGVDDKLAKTLSEVVIDGLKESGFRSIAKWQYTAINDILSALAINGINRHYVITAPTAAGKTLVFQVIAIAYVLLQKALSRGRSSGEYSRVLILYPRKALQKQQLERLLKPLHFINKKLKEKGVTNVITVAIDKGVESTNTKITPGTELDTKIRCPHTEKHTIKIKYEDGGKGRLRQEIVCSDGLKLDYIIRIVHTKQDRNILAAYNPDILISNPWTLKSRLLSPQSSFRDLYRLRGLVILDEAHVYTNVNYIDLIASIRLHYNIRRIDNNLGSPVVIAASATIRLDDPRKLLSWILDVKENDVKHIDYFKLEPPRKERQRLKIIVTLLPYRLSLETTLQGIIQVILTATSNNNLKSIVFVDSISEASTIMGYLDTILVKRNSVEICDHISSKSCRENQEDILSIRPSLSVNANYLDDYSWGHYVNIESNKMKIKDLLSQIRKLINFVGLHHGALSDEERKELESGFTTGSKKLLISTSTLDLGMDYDDVTFIVQYKEPISGEVLEQRIGRAGRKDEAARISLAFYLPTVTPNLLQKIFGKRARDEETVVLPDESNITWHYLAQVLEYEILQALRDLVNTSGRRSLDIIEQGLLNTLYECLTKNGFENLIKKWLLTSEKKKLELEITIPILYIKSIDRDAEKKIRSIWRKLRNLDIIYKKHLNKAYYEKKIKEKIEASKITKIISEDDVANLSHELRRAIKRYINDLIKSIELCENIQDLEYNLDFIKNRITQCTSLLNNSLEKIREDTESYKDIMKLIESTEVVKARKGGVREWLKYALLVEELERLLSDVGSYIKELNEYLRHDKYMTMFYASLITSKPIRSKYTKRCKKCEINENIIGKCWYSCLRRSIVLALYNTRAMHSAFREYGTIGLSVVS